MRILLLSLLLTFASIGSQAKEFDIHQAQVTLLDSTPLTLAEFAHGKPLYLKFWASWCKPCMEQMPHFEHVQQQYGDQIQVLAVNIDINETREAIQQVVERFSLTMPIALDSDDSLATALNFIGTPYHVLINRAGEIVHQGHEADAKLDHKLKLLATDPLTQLPTVPLTDMQGNKTSIAMDKGQTSLLFFTATWCDWYLEKTRPEMSQACIVAQQNINQIFAEHPDYPLQGITNNIWTEPKDLTAYVNKYAIKHPILLDHSGDLFFTFGIKQVPTLILIKDGKQVFKTGKLGDLNKLQQQLAEYLP